MQNVDHSVFQEELGPVIFYFIPAARWSKLVRAERTRSEEGRFDSRKIIEKDTLGLFYEKDEKITDEGRRDSVDLFPPPPSVIPSM